MVYNLLFVIEIIIFHNPGNSFCSPNMWLTNQWSLKYNLHTCTYLGIFCFPEADLPCGSSAKLSRPCGLFTNSGENMDAPFSLQSASWSNLICFFHPTYNLLHCRCKTAWLSFSANQISAISFSRNFENQFDLLFFFKFFSNFFLNF